MPWVVSKIAGDRARQRPVPLTVTNQGESEMAKRNSNIGKVCSVDGCSNGAVKRLMCETHYRRIMNNGTIELTRQPAGSLVKHGNYFTIRVGGKRKRQHVHIAELALGKPLPHGAVVHHVNEDGRDNTNSNLAIFPDRAYHNLIHLRMRSLAATGRADMRKCEHCGEWDDPENMSSYDKRGVTTAYYHKRCAAETVSRNKRNRQTQSQCHS